MNVPKLINRIQASLDRPPNHNKILDSINTAISRINSLIEPFDSYMDIIFADTGIPSAETRLPSAITDPPSEMGKILSTLTYSADSGSNRYKLTITDVRIMKIKNVYKDGLALRKRSAEGIFQEIYTGYEYAIIGRDIYFTSDISTGTDTYQIKCNIRFEPVTSSTGDYDIPAYFDDLIYNFAIQMLSKDNNQVSMAKQYIQSELETAGIKTNIWS